MKDELVKIEQLNNLSKALKYCNPVNEKLLLTLYDRIGINLN